MKSSEMWTGTSLIIFILSITHFFTFSCARDIWCYECAFGPSPPALVDVCRPGNFNVSSVHTIKCPYGCRISVVYEFEPNALERSVSKPFRLTTNTTWIDHKKNSDAITFVIRNCAERKLPKPGCEVKDFTYMHHEDCYCSEDYCNGYDGSLSLTSFFSNLLTLLPLTVTSILVPHLVSSHHLLNP